MAAPTAPTSPPGPLDGSVMLGIAQAVAAPFATCQLADLGPRVIKIERPAEGDFARGYGRTVNGQSSHFVWLNRVSPTPVSAPSPTFTDHPQLAARNRWRAADTPAGSVQALLPPVTNDWNESMGAMPARGQHTDDGLAWLNLDSTTTPSKKASAR